MNFLKEDDFKEIVENRQVTSLEDYEKIIEDIKETLKRKNINSKIFYRGDTGEPKNSPRIIDNLKQENEDFNKWISEKEKNDCNYCHNCEYGSFECLANMQHYGSAKGKYKTRLIDFTSDPKIALRFACGDKGKNQDQDQDRYISIYISDFEVINSKDSKLDKYINLIKDDYISDERREELRNCFVEFHPSKKNELSERIKRQKGLFLVCGQDKKSKEKSIAKLSSKYGRGESYGGFFYNLRIEKEYIDGIREELEADEKYKIDYLMPEDKGE